MNMKQRTIAICALLAALWCAGCGSVFNGAIDDMTLRQTGWYTFLGGTGVDQAISVQRTSDGGYIVAGYAGATIDPLRMKNAPCRNPYSGSSNDMLVVKLDAAGNVAWYTFLGGTGSDIAQSVQQTSDGGYIVAGRASATIGTDRMQNAPCRNPYSGSIDMLIVKLDSSGDVAWYTFLGSTTGSDFANSVQQTSDSGYIIAGNANATIDTLQGKRPINSFGGGTNYDMLVAKLDSSGNVDWYTFLGGTGIEQALSMQHTPDGGCIVAGFTSTDLTLPQGTKLGAFSGGHDMLVVKLDSGGMVSWYTLLGGTGQDTARSIEQTSDGGYIVAGNTNVAISTLQGKEPLNKFAGGIEYDMLIVKLRNDGTL